jgi:hypothetical protein
MRRLRPPRSDRRLRPPRSDRRLRPEPWLLAPAVAAAFAAVYLAAAPLTADFAAQTFRSDLFAQHGFTIWNGQWFGGHHTPGYSLLSPPLGALLGPRVMGVVAAIVAAVLFERIASVRWGRRAWVGAVWFAGATATNLFTGRLTFGVGVAVALGAVLAAQRGRRALALVLAAGSSVASPVAGLFLALGAIAYALAERRPNRRLPWFELSLAAAAFCAAAVISLMFPEGGHQPYARNVFWPVLGYAAMVLVFVPREERWLRVAAVLYLVANTACLFIDTPMGGNASRLGTLFGGPLLACALWRRRTRPLLAVVPLLLYWQWKAPYTDVNKGTGDRSTHASYFAPLLGFLKDRRHSAIDGRIEIPFTRNHFETVYVAERFPIARGWERQIDIHYNGVFYRRQVQLPTLAYRRWLDRLAVRYVALSDVRPDYSSKLEAAAIAGGLPYLRPVWSSAHWRVYEVRSPTPMASGPVTLTRLGTESFALRAHRAGTALVRVRYTPYWKVTAGAGCIERGRNGMTRLELAGAGEVRVAASFALDRVFDHGPRCRHATPLQAKLAASW